MPVTRARRSASSDRGRGVLKGLLTFVVVMGPLLTWALLVGGFSAPGVAEAPSTAPATGLREHTPQVHALVGAKLVMAPGKTIERGTLVIRDGVIVAAGGEVATPADARVWDVAGK